jgi:hypothetical protein
LLQLEDDGVFFLAGLPQLFIEHTLLDQHAREPRDLLVKELEGCLRRFLRGTLPLKLALRFLSGQTLTPEGGQSLLEDRPLLLELSLHLLAHAPLLLELLLHRGKRAGLVRQVGPQLLSIFGLLLDLALPRSCPLEGGVVLLESSLHRGERRLPLRSRNPHRGQVLARLLQRLILLQKRRRHHVDRGDAFRSLGALVQELVPHSLQLVLQPPVVGTQGLDEDVEGVVLVSVLVELGAQLSEAVVPLPSSALQLLSPADKTREKSKSENAQTQKE